jgi:hypothetical protein
MSTVAKPLNRKAYGSIGHSEPERVSVGSYGAQDSRG